MRRQPGYGDVPTRRSGLTNGGVPVRSLVTSCLAGLAFVAAAVLGAVQPASAVTPDQLSECPQPSQAIARADGSVLVAGFDDYSCDPYDATPGTTRPILIQLKADGTIDNGFSEGGVKVFDDLTGEAPVELLDPEDGGVLLVTGQHFIKVREDGSLDQGFGDNGMVNNPGQVLGFTYNSIEDAILQPDGRIVVTGDNRIGRFKANGQIDDTFSGDGVVEEVIPPGKRLDRVELAIDSSGRILVAGTSGYQEIAAMRFGPDGTPDGSYGGSGLGLATVSPYYSDAVDSVYPRPDGSLRVYGRGSSGLYQQSSLTVLDSGGVIDPDRSRPISGYGFAFAENGFGEVTYSDQPFRGDEWIFNVAKAGSGFLLAPGRSQLVAIDYSPADESFIAIGKAFTSGCFNCDDEYDSEIAVAKINSFTFKRDFDFSRGYGAVLVPGNECPHGTGPFYRPRVPDSDWNRCRVKPPKFKAGIRLLQPRGSRPVLAGTVQIRDVDAIPYLIGHRVTVGLPPRLKFGKRSSRRIFVGPVDGGSVSASLDGRLLNLEFVPAPESCDVYGGLPSANKPVRFKFNFSPGAFKPLGKKLRRQRLNFAVTATDFPTESCQSSSSTWFAPNSFKRVLRVRPLSG